MGLLGKALRFFTPKGYICIAVLILLGTVTIHDFYNKYKINSLDKKVIKLNKDKKDLEDEKEQLEKDYQSCQDTIKAINEYEIENSKQQIKTRKRINRVKAHKGDNINFNSIW